jgi:hypothetical protein
MAGAKPQAADQVGSGSAVVYIFIKRVKQESPLHVTREPTNGAARLPQRQFQLKENEIDHDLPQPEENSEEPSTTRPTRQKPQTKNPTR